MLRVCVQIQGCETNYSSEKGCTSEKGSTENEPHADLSGLRFPKDKMDKNVWITVDIRARKITVIRHNLLVTLATWTH